MTRTIKGSLKLEPGAAPTAAKGVMYFDSTADKIKISEDGSTFTQIDTGTTGYINIFHMQADTTNTPTAGVIGLNPSVEFADAATETAYFSFEAPVDLDASADVVLEIAFVGKTTGTSDSWVLEIASNSITNAGDSTPTTESTLTETIAVPDTAEELKQVTTTTAKIPASIITAGDQISVSFSRLGADVSDDYAGVIAVLSVRVKYTKA